MKYLIIYVVGIIVKSSGAFQELDKVIRYKKNIRYHYIQKSSKIIIALRGGPALTSLD